MPVQTTCPRCAVLVTDEAAYCPRCGIAQPGRTPVTTSESSPHGTGHRPADPQRGRRPSWRLIVALAVVGLVLAAAVPFVSRSIVLTPAGAVAAYYAALADRDADRARSLFTASALAAAENELLTNRALRNAGYHPPERLRIEGTAFREGQTVVRATYEIDGFRYTTEQTLVRTTDSWRRRWSIESLYQLPLPYVATDAYLVAGTQIPAGRSSTSGVFAGGYRIGLPDNPIQAAQPITVRAGSREAGALRPGLRDSARRSVEAQVREYLDRCAASTELWPEGCPFSAGSSTPVTDVRWTITQYPTLEVTLASNGAISVSSSSGTATVTGRSRSAAGEPFSDSKSFSVYGSAQAVSGKVIFMPR